MDTKSNSEPPRSLFGKYRDLSHRILHYAHLTEPRVVFVQHLTDLILDAFPCDAVELRFRNAHSCTHFGAVRGLADGLQRSVVSCSCEAGGFAGCGNDTSPFSRLCREVACGRMGPDVPNATRYGSVFTDDAQRYLAPPSPAGAAGPRVRQGDDPAYRSLGIIPLTLAEQRRGLLILKSRRRDLFSGESSERIALAEAIAETIGMAAAHHRAQAALRERVKELMCLYGISKIVEIPDISLQEIMERIVGLLPPAWQYPEITQGRITFDRHGYGASAIDEEWPRISADIMLAGERRGMVEVAHSQKRPELDEGPFLEEERHLIEAIAAQVAQIIERRQAEEDRVRLRRQLRHADRLATIGQLAAGIAHEFNEPLGNILGFAELALKHAATPDDTRRDLEKIVSASMHAREVVRKLMWFARELPPSKSKVNLNNIVNEGLYLLEARCAKAGITLVRALAPDLPDIVADAAQLQQVLVNLVVNATQAMPGGGTITIITRFNDDLVSVIVEDTGVGMPEEVRERVFIPFFTTKDVDEGTGLGLAVVHGIVSSHGADIRVESKEGEGSRFEIRFPPAPGAVEEKEGPHAAS